VAPQDKKKQLSNSVSDYTGQYDARFILWRKFCKEQNIAPDTLPSNLYRKQLEKWEKIKKEKLL
jgi:hypothetical protein